MLIIALLNDVYSFPVMYHLMVLTDLPLSVVASHMTLVMLTENSSLYGNWNAFVPSDMTISM